MTTLPQAIEELNVYLPKTIFGATEALAEAMQIIRELQKQRVMLREGLGKLVWLKDYKDAHGKDAYYQSAMPLTWQRAVLALQNTDDNKEIGE